MYTEFFGLAEKPFSLTPNPAYVFQSDRYRSALDHLRYGIREREGFMLLTGMVGTGKTTMCRDLLESLDPKHHRTALLFNPFLNGVEMLQALLTELGCDYPAKATQKQLLERLNRFLLAQLVEGCTCIAIFDEAQHLSEESLEHIRVLSNLETDKEKLIQIILVGQPELRQRIEQASLAQLDQRVSVRCTLSHLNQDEMERYIYHRLNVAGAQGRIQFNGRALRRIYQESQGVPRLINLICDRTLLAGYVAQTTRIGVREVEQALTSLRGGDTEEKPPARITSPARRRRWPVMAFPLGALVAAAFAAAYWYTGGVLP